MQPFRPHPAQLYVQPEVDRALYPAPGWLIDREGKALLEAQRRQRSPWGTFHIGGGADVAIASEEGVKVGALIEWGDELGGPISP